MVLKKYPVKHLEQWIWNKNFKGLSKPLMSRIQFKHYKYIIIKYKLSSPETKNQVAS